MVKDQKVLLMKSVKGFWELPGGRIDGDESIPQTLLRELSEELPGISNIQVGEVLDCQRLHKDIKEGISLVLIFCSVTAELDESMSLSSEHTAFGWFSQAEALDKVDQITCSAIKAAFVSL